MDRFTMSRRRAANLVSRVHDRLRRTFRYPVLLEIVILHMIAFALALGVFLTVDSQRRADAIYELREAGLLSPAEQSPQSPYGVPTNAILNQSESSTVAAENMLHRADRLSQQFGVRLD